MTDDERRQRRIERAAEVKRRQKRALVLTAVAIVVLAVAVFSIRFVTDALSAPPPERDVHATDDTDTLALQRARQKNETLRRRVRKLRRRVHVQRSNFRHALHASSVGTDWIERAFLCVHRFERGANGWRTNTGNGYDGGLQMDDSFQRAYGAPFLRAFGPAYRWPRSVQIAVAIEAWTTRGFHPWPNTARECGLL